MPVSSSSSTSSTPATAPAYAASSDSSSSYSAGSTAGSSMAGLQPSSNYPESTSVNSGSGSANLPSTASTGASTNMPTWNRFGQQAPPAPAKRLYVMA